MVVGKNTALVIDGFEKLMGGAEANYKSKVGGMERHTKSIDNTMTDFFDTVKTGTDRFRLLGLIGLGTLSAIFVNTPILKAGFDVLNTSLVDLFTTITEGGAFDVFDEWAQRIDKFNTMLQNEPELLSLAQNLVNLTLNLAIMTAILWPITIAFRTLIGVWGIASTVILRFGSILRGLGMLFTLIRTWMPFLFMFFRGFAIAVSVAFAVITVLIAGAIHNWAETLESFKVLFRGFAKVLDGIVNLDIKMVFDGLVMIVDGAFSVIADAVEGVLDLIDGAINKIGELTGLWSNVDLSGAYEGFMNMFGIGSTVKVNDAIITPSGQVIQTDPADYLIATKNPGSISGGSNTEVVINFDGAKIYLSEGFEMDDFVDGLSKGIAGKMGRRV